MTGAATEGSPCLAPVNQIFTVSEGCRPLSSQNSLYSSTWQEGPPQSPLTDSTISSQESAAELVDHGAGQNILGLGHLFADGPAYDSLSAHSSYDRPSSLNRSFTELASPRNGFGVQSGSWTARNYNAAFAGEGRSSLRGRTNSYRTLFEQVSSINPGQSLIDKGIPERALTVEHLVAVIRNLPANQPVVRAVEPGLKFMDSRAVAFLLKDTAKNGFPQRAIEIFDWLRKQPASHELSRLCDVYTYTTVISLCGQRQSLASALELVAEMRSRGVPCNVHTYSALMNTCIKCNELELALDVFEQLKGEGCTANVVTYNTLVDVFGKLGRWQDAIGVIDDVYQQGLKPEVRTFNTVIIAANMCNQPAEALKVYDRMLKSGYTPTATTYTALISSYGKAGDLDSALDIFRLMVQKGLDRNVITYSSLILASDRAGRWQLALDLLNEMRGDRITPNTATFNSLMNACAQGAQSQKAEEIFQAMLSKRCKPNNHTYSALLLAHIQADHWRAAHQTWQAMQAANSPPEPALYASLIQCLWDSGVYSAQAQAAQLFSQGCLSGAVPPCLCNALGRDKTLEVFITSPNTSIAILAFHKWLRETHEKVSSKGRNCLGLTIKISTGSQSSESAGCMSTYNACHTLTVLYGLLECMRSPFRVINQGVTPKIVGDSWETADWLLKTDVRATLADYIPFPALTETRVGRDGYTSRNIAATEASYNLQLRETHKHINQAENQQEARLAAALECYCSPREEYLSLAINLAERLGISPELAFTAMAFLDSALVAGLASTKTNGSILVAACLVLAVRKYMPQETVVRHMELLEATLSSNGSLAQILDQLTSVGVYTNTPVVCPLLALKQYQDHLKMHLALPELGKSVSHNAATARSKALDGSRELLAKAMLQRQCQRIRPTLLAAAALVVDRQAHGLNPLWPNSLAKWTGMAGPGSSDFEAAIQAVLPALAC